MVGTEPKTLVDSVAERMAELSGGTCFMCAGGLAMYLTDAVGRRNDVYRVHCHTEHAAICAADAYARLTGKAGWCVVTGGPGATNLATGALEAWQASSDVRVFVGDVRREHKLSRAGDARQRGMFWAPARDVLLPLAGSRSRPGPMVSVYGLDEQLDVPTSDICLPLCRCWSNAVAREAINMLGTADRLLILAGQGVRRAGGAEVFRQVVDTLGVPVVLTAAAADLLPWHHEKYVGILGIKGHRPAWEAAQQADVILVVGSGLRANVAGWSGELLAGAKRVWVDVENGEYQLDAKHFLEALLATKPTLPRWLPDCSRYAATGEGMPRVIRALTGGEMPDRRAVFIADAGQLTYQLPQYAQLTEGHRILLPSSGAMGWAIPACIGACVAEKGRLCFAVVGDGSFAASQDLATLAQFPNARVLVALNGGYASIRSTQRRYCGGRYYGSTESDLRFPPVLAVANAMGFRAGSASWDALGDNLHWFCKDDGHAKLLAVQCPYNTEVQAA